MKSIIQETVAKHQEGQALLGKRTPETALGRSVDDEEIEKIAEALKVNIRVVGCGGGGSNTINRCMEEGIQGAEMCALNTDVKHLLSIHASRKVLIGRRTTKGLGAGARPEIGEEAARENEQEIRQFLQGAQLVFVTAGMGGGTGTGTAHLVAQLAKEQGALTMGVVTLPFSGEGAARMEQAKDGLERLRGSATPRSSSRTTNCSSSSPACPSTRRSSSPTRS